MPPKGIGSLTGDSEKLKQQILAGAATAPSGGMPAQKNSSSDGMSDPAVSVGMQICQTVQTNSFNAADAANGQQTPSKLQQQGGMVPSPSHACGGASYVDEAVHDLQPHIKVMLRRHITSEVSIAKEQHGNTGATTGGKVVHSDKDYFFVLKRVADPDRARREREHCEAKVRHPHILKYLYAAPHRNNMIDVEIEFAELGTLESIFYAMQSLEERCVAAKACARQVLSGLVCYSEVYSRCHRDIKTSNFLLARNGCCKVADFDVARSFTQKDIRECDITIRGTQGYLSPEMTENHLVLDPLRCDAWSLGVTIMQGVERAIDTHGGKRAPTAVLPFDRFKLAPHQGPSQEMCEQLHWELFASSPDLEFVTRKCLVRDPNNRANLLELLAATFVVRPPLLPRDIDRRAAEIADAAIAASAKAKSTAAAAAAAGSPTSKAATTAAAASTTAALESSMNGRAPTLASSDVWADCFLDESDDCAKKAAAAGIELCDAVLRGHVCTSDDPRAWDKVKEAAAALQREFASWKAARQGGEEKAREADKVMRDVVVMRNKKCIKFMADAAKRHQITSIIASLQDESGRPNVPMK